MNRLLQKLALYSLLSFSLCSTTAQGNIFLNVAQEQAHKISKKPVAHKPSLEFKQAVARYIKHTDIQCFTNMQRNTDENISYKKELRYLFKNYGKFSAVTLLARLRSAHQAMVKYDTNVEGEVYKKYEQICSALLLTCTQVFFNDARNQILNALHEIDNLLVYWRYQQNHQVKYFFSKSPMKWIVGKDQEKEIVHNVIKLERKQRELYTLLGSLTGHIHLFAETGTTYETCYTWIEELFEMTPCIKTSDYYTHDETRFDIIAGKLELKLKRVAKFKEDCLSSIARAKKPNHFVRNWIVYTTVLATTAYLINYNSKNPEVIRSAVHAAQDEVGKFFVLLLHPLQKIYERGKLVFSDEKKIIHPEKTVNENEKDEKDGMDNVVLEDLLKETIKVGEETVSDIAQELAKSKISFRQDALEWLDEIVEKIKKPEDGIVFSSTYTFDEAEIKKNIKIVGDKIEAMKSQEGRDEYAKALESLYKAMDKDLPKILNNNLTGAGLKFQLPIVDRYLKIVDELLDPLQRYTEIIDTKILRLFQLAAVVVENLARRGDILANKAEEQLKYADDQLRDNELTFMFTALIPLGCMCFGASKMYQWTTTRDYSPIRIALADVNSLLIESATHLDDYDYGKLVYLICKLRHRSTYLKDPLSNEFLSDVTKLESKQYSAQIKRGIVENMFNKYAFLGRIAV